MNTSQPPSPRRRLQALLAIPDSQRTDAEWDELNELEIQLAPGNRIGAPEPGARRNAPAGSNNPKSSGGRQKAAQGAGGGGSKSGGNAGAQPQQGKKPFKKPRKKSGGKGGEGGQQAGGGEAPVQSADGAARGEGA